MTKEILIQIIRDSLVNGNQKAAHDAIDDYDKQECRLLLKFMSRNDMWVFKDLFFSATSDTELTFDQLHNLYLQSKQ